jgi:hypothetical protein
MNRTECSSNLIRQGGCITTIHNVFSLSKIYRRFDHHISMVLPCWSNFEVTRKKEVILICKCVVGVWGGGGAGALAGFKLGAKVCTANCPVAVHVGVVLLLGLPCFVDGANMFSSDYIWALYDLQGTDRWRRSSLVHVLCISSPDPVIKVKVACLYLWTPVWHRPAWSSWCRYDEVFLAIVSLGKSKSL